MSSIIIATLGFIFVFGLVVFIHEFGHFIVAKWRDVEVEAFSLGMGPSIMSYQYGETEYRICVLPLGGYVKMAGEEIEDRDEEDDNPRAFHNKSVWSRVAILLAGATFNILLGYVLYVPFGMFQGESIQPPKVGYVPETMQVRDENGDTNVIATPAYDKLKVGDRILSLNGEAVDTFKDITIRNSLLGEQQREFLVKRNDEKRIVEIDPVKTVRKQLNQPTYVVGISSFIDSEIDRVNEGSKAEEAGVEAGDRITTLGDTPIRSGTEFRVMVSDLSGTYVIGIQDKQGKTYEISTYIPGDNEQLQSWASQLGIGLQIPTRQYSFLESFKFAGKRTVRDIQLMFEAIGGLVSQRLSPKSLAGPVGIVQMTGQVALVGIWPLIRFTAFFSINLGVVNLLPIPVLDGGHILLAIPEMFTGKKLPDKVIGYANRFGFAVLIAFIIFVTFFDLERVRFFETVFNLFGM